MVGGGVNYITHSCCGDNRAFLCLKVCQLPNMAIMNDNSSGVAKVTLAFWRGYILVCK